MKKKVFSKKMALSILAGVLVTIAIIGAGTYAWFTSSDNTVEAEFTAAKVKAAVENTDSGFLLFCGNAPAILSQVSLESAIGANNYNQVAMDAAFAKWWKDLYDDSGFGNILYGSTGDYVTPGSILYTDYTITNESNVPVYYRIKADKISALVALTSTPIECAYLVYSEDSDALLEYYDGYYYSTVPLDPSDPDFNGRIIVEAYFTGANENGLQEANIAFGDGAVEFIQADNNAVFIEPTWKDAAFALGFKSSSIDF